MDNVQEPPVVPVAPDTATDATPVEKQIDTVAQEDTVVDTATVDPTSDVKDLDKNDKSLPEALMFPTALYSEMVKLLENVNKLTREQFKAKFSENDNDALGINIESMRYTNTEDMLAEPLNDSDMGNSIKYAGKDLSIRPLPINSKGKALNGDAAIARLSSALGIGETTQIPLWHSGFWVTLKPIKDIDFINLELQLTNNQIILGRDTNSLVFSNYSVVFNRIISDFIVNNIQNSTLDIPADEDIRKYIKVQDYYMLVLGVLYSMFPGGYTLTRTCINSNFVDENDVPKCSAAVSAKVDFRKLAWVNRKAIDKAHLELMSKRNPNVSSIDSVIDYQDTLYVNKEQLIKLTTSSGVKINLSVKTPSLADYVDNGELWINNIIKNSESVFTESADEEEKNRIVNENTSAVILGIYNIYVSKITMDDDSTIEGRSEIDDSLGLLSGDVKILEDLINGVKEYINKNTIAIPGLPNYECAACGELQKGEDTYKPFKEIIPINVVESFFDLCVLKALKAKSRSI